MPSGTLCKMVVRREEIYRDVEEATGYGAFVSKRERRKGERQ
jgi:hypothetical protein